MMKWVLDKVQTSPIFLKLLKIGAVCIALLLALPILSVFVELFYTLYVNFSAENTNTFIEIKENLQHFFSYLFIKFIKDTFFVLFGVLFFALFIGVSCAYLIANFEFYLCKILEKILMLPLAIPAYILAFIYVGIMDYQGAFYQIFGFRVDLFNLYGVIFVLSISLFPYVYMFAKTAFKSESIELIEVSKTLHLNELQIFFKVAIHTAKPAIISGLMLVFMETLSDYGASAYFGVDTFSAGIFKLWYDLGDPYSSAVLSGFLMIFVFFVMYAEYYYKTKKHYSFNQNLKHSLKKRQLSKSKALLACIYCLFVATLGFIMPFIWLAYWGLQDDKITQDVFYNAAFKTLGLGLVSALIIVFLAYLLSFIARIAKHKIFAILILKVSSLGYAIPGAAIGVSIMIVCIFIANLTGINMLGQSLLVLIFAYVVRFLATAIYSLESGYNKIHDNSDEATLFIRKSFFALFWNIHTPLLKNFLSIAFVIVLIDTLKELPLSRMLAPFGFETLAVKAYWYASDERIYDAALPSLFIVFLSAVVILWVEYFSKEKYAKD